MKRNYFNEEPSKLIDNAPNTTKKFHIVLSWDDVPPLLGPKAAIDIENSFVHRPWHENVVCKWDHSNRSLVLEASNDFDEKGLALMDEFSDEISACVINPGDGNIRLISVERK